MALQLVERGIDEARVYALLGGLAAWEGAGYPVE